MGIRDKFSGKFTAGRSSTNFRVFRNQETDWLFRRKLGYMNEKAAEIGECLFVASRIKERNPESWINEWAGLAGRLDNNAETMLAQGHIVSAREAFWRASNYYHTAEYGASPAHPRFHELWEQGVKAFQKACPLFDPPIQIIEVPFEDKKLPGYFWRPDSGDSKHPTLVASGGNDSTLEEVMFISGPAAVRRGYNFFTFDFPGHRGAVHLYYPNHVKRPDMEVPFKAAFDFLETLPGVDERIALTGFSYGGYIASRVAAHEKRVRAVIPDSPLIDVYASQMAMLNTLALKIPDGVMVTMMNWQLKRSPHMKSMLEYAMWTAGYEDRSARSVIQEMKLGTSKVYSMVDDLHRITCPALAMVSEDEGEELTRQAKQFYAGISSTNKKMHILTLAEDGSNDHCQLDNRTRGNQIMLDWLDEVFK